MKCEITQGQWVDFFNTLTDSQKTTRDITGAAGKNTDGVYKRNTVAWTNGLATTTTRDRACNYLLWADGAAFADWSGLRPITELEFEKACRGPLTPVVDEYAWGTISITAQTGHSGTDGIGTETATPSGANCCYNNTMDGPVRAGIYAKAASSREAAGASYWGIMELSGNLWERTIWIGHAAGRGFTGLNGDGVLTVGGDADVSGWQGASATFAGYRGGGWRNGNSYARVSDRAKAPYWNGPRESGWGWRAVRSAPSGVGP